MSQTPAKRPTFVLGTAQLGAAYGWSNTVGELSSAASLALMERAYDLGVREFDTARAYAGSEAQIGAFLKAYGLKDLKVVTKLSPLAELDAGASPRSAAEAALRSLSETREALGRERLDTLLLHRCAHLTAFEGAILDVLRRERAAGRIGEIGVSVGGPEEFDRALQHAEVRHVQLPFNLLDDRWERSPDGPEGLRVHLRSVFLQGLLANATSVEWPRLDGLDDAALAAALVGAVETFGRESLQDLALAFVRAQSWAAGCVIGCERIEQLEQNLALFDRPPLTIADCEALRAALPSYPNTLLQPWLWRR